jgi:hypothetical protein
MNRKGLETLSIIIMAIVLIATAAVLLYIGPKNLLAQAKNMMGLSECSGISTGGLSKGNCKDAKDCSGFGASIAPCSGKGQVCCFDDDTSTMGIFDPSLISESLKDCDVSKASCDDKCKVTLKQNPYGINIESSYGDKSTTFIGADYPFYITFTLDPAYPGVTKCLDYEGGSFYFTITANGNNYDLGGSNYQCAKKTDTNNWVTYQCQIKSIPANFNYKDTVVQVKLELYLKQRVGCGCVTEGKFQKEFSAKFK